MSDQLAFPAHTNAPNVWQRRIGWMLIALSVLLAISSITIFVVATFTSSSSSANLQTVADLALPAGVPSFDQQALDATTGKLFLAYTGASEVLVFDSKTNKLIGRIPNIKKGHGLAVIPGLHRLYVSETLDNQVYAIDENTLRVMAKIPVGQKPDMIAYDAADGQLFVSNELGQSDSVIDAETNKVIATIPVGGEAGNTRYDAALHRIFVTVQTNKTVVAIDPATHKIVNTLTLPTTCNHNHELILDTTQQLGFVGCDGNAQLFMIDVQAMKALNAQPQTTGANPDLTAFDDSRHLLYVSTHSGVLSIFSDANKTIQKVDEQCIGTNAHSISVDQNTHHIYMPFVKVQGDSCTPVATAPAKAGTKVAALATNQAVLQVMLFHYGNI